MEFSIVIIPQYLDIKLNKTNNKYINFYKNLNNKNIFELTNEIVKKNWESFYFDDKYGGHLIKKGNKLVSEIILNKLKINIDMIKNKILWISGISGVGKQQSLRF